MEEREYVQQSNQSDVEDPYGEFNRVSLLSCISVMSGNM